jgi:hypothetical protein
MKPVLHRLGLDLDQAELIRHSRGLLLEAYRHPAFDSATKAREIMRHL